MKMPHRLLAAILLCGAGVSTAAAQSPEVQLRIAIEDDRDGAALRLLDEAGPQPFPVAVRVELAELTAAVDARIVAVERRQTPLWLAIPAPASQADLERWRSALRAVLERRQSTLTVLEVMVDREPAAVAVFAVQVAATEARARRASVQTAIGGPAMDDTSRLREIYSKEVAPYIDLIATTSDPDEVATWLREIDPSARIALRGRSAQDTDPSRRVVEDVLQDLGTAVAFRAWRAADITAAAIRLLSPLSSLLTHPISTLDAAAVGLRLTIAQADVVGTGTSPAAVRYAHVLHAARVLGRSGRCSARRLVDARCGRRTRDP